MLRPDLLKAITELSNTKIGKKKEETLTEKKKRSSNERHK